MRLIDIRPGTRFELSAWNYHCKSIEFRAPFLVMAMMEIVFEVLRLSFTQPAKFMQTISIVRITCINWCARLRHDRVVIEKETANFYWAFLICISNTIRTLSVPVANILLVFTQLIRPLPHL